MAYMAYSDSNVMEQTRTKIATPKSYYVVYLNDNKTTFEFVIESLVSIFNHSYESAQEVAKTVHESGSAVVEKGLLKSIAETKCAIVMSNAERYGYPLKAIAKQE